MNEEIVFVTDAAGLLQAVKDKVKTIKIEGKITELSSMKLLAGTCLHGSNGQAELHFKQGQPGLMLSAEHRISGVRLVVDETQIALGLSDDVESLGVLDISNVRTVGRFHLEGCKARSGHLRLRDIHVERADARMAAHRPAGFGVEVLLGGLSVYNFSKDKTSRWTLEAHNLSCGSKAHPIQGSGVFVFGGWFIPVDADMSTAPAPTQQGGAVEVSVLTTGEVHSHGGIPQGTGNLITGGVFIGSGVQAKEVVSEGEVTTYGSNDMVLDNWGAIQSWTAKALITSFGSSGIGMVNFGDIGLLDVQAPIETHGLGARGFNLYDGTLGEARFRDITTHGNGAIGIQLSKPFGKITVNGDVRTKGGEGDSLVRGKVVHLKANALSLKPGARGEALKVSGRVVAENSEINDLDFEVPLSVIDSVEIETRV